MRRELLAMLLGLIVALAVVKFVLVDLVMHQRALQFQRHHAPVEPVTVSLGLDKPRLRQPAVPAPPAPAPAAASSVGQAQGTVVSGQPPAPATQQVTTVSVWETGDNGKGDGWGSETAPTPTNPQPDVPDAVPQPEPVPPEVTRTAPSVSTTVTQPVAIPTTADVDDLNDHKANPQCWNHFDIGYIDDWNAKKQEFCVPTAAGEKAGLGGSLHCRVMDDKHLPSATSPHTMCDGKNVVIDFALLRPARCPKHRPGYKCSGPPVFFHYQPGAVKAACTRTKSFRTLSFPKDHLRDIFGSFQEVPAPGSLQTVRRAAGPVTLLLTRERNEHANLFHATTDFLNAFEALYMAGIIDIHREGDRTGMDRVQVMILDQQAPGPFDVMFDKVFSPKYPVTRVDPLRTSSTDHVRLFPHAVFSPPGYTNTLFAHLFTDSDCRSHLHLLQSFRKFVLAGFGIPLPVPVPELRVVFISRKPYTKFVEHKFVGRQVTNEPELMGILNGMANVKAELVDLVHLTYEEQVTLVASTDLLIGMHGAALSHAVLLPPWAAVLELWPKQTQMWRCFEHLSEMAGLVYRRWANADAGAFYKDRNGDYTRVNAAQFSTMVQAVIGTVRERQAEHKAHHGR